ncbi:hypothetical protein FPQ10_11720 [Allobacillus sp. SKP2-8]|uniref:arylsulfotransferase family protein n=1 Tax=unclassified Allobacillus TaxID=2628859 RepID=UPI0011844DB3|nr:arylsulfotransferase family protein [Allobacillus sp. SKP2-8]TSJ62536.1 hypothetical protein FPQ10_11720 [Allobacillus sp. SKP2-8]
MNNKWITFVIAFLLGVGLTSAAGFVFLHGSNSNEETEKFIGVDKKSIEEDNWIKLPNFNKKEESYELKSLSSKKKVTLDLRDYKNRKVIINGKDVTGQDSHELEIESISENNKISIGIDEKTYEVNTLPKYLSEYKYENNGATDGFYYFTYEDYIVKLSTNGEIVYYNKVGSAYDFKANKTKDGEIYYTYMVVTNTQEKIPGIGYSTTKAVIMDENYNVVDEVRSIIETDKVHKTPLENHDFLFIDLGHYIVSSYYPEKVDNIPNQLEPNPFGARVVSPYLQEIKDNEVIWEWKGTEFEELYELSVEHNDYSNEHSFYSDYGHFNAVSVDPGDENLLVSMRNLDSIFKLDRKSGEIIWMLGGKGDDFSLTEEMEFRRQHKVTKTEDGSIMLFNNGNYLPKAPYPIVDEDDPIREKEPQTTIMKFKLDEENKEVLNFENLDKANYFSGTRGSAQETASGSILIGWGSGENNKEHFREIDADTEEVLFVFYPHDEDLISYRAYKFDY